MGSSGKIVPVQVVLFDGLCNLCSGSVQFIIKRDPDQRFQFASLQSEFGQKALIRLGLDVNKLHSIVVLSEGKVYHRSDAALQIARNLGGLWPIFYIFKFLPRFFRDWLYNIVARYRYKLFGKKDECWIPTPQLSDRFIS
jgi:predicted DCC family thiol-disulfide oxidoreductase YuxK